jgi:hypothetical protein
MLWEHVCVCVHTHIYPYIYIYLTMTSSHWIAPPSIPSLLLPLRQLNRPTFLFRLIPPEDGDCNERRNEIISTLDAKPPVAESTHYIVVQTTKTQGPEDIDECILRVLSSGIYRHVVRLKSTDVSEELCLTTAFTLVSCSACSSTLQMEAMFLRNVSCLSTDYRALYSGR